MRTRSLFGGFAGLVAVAPSVWAGGPKPLSVPRAASAIRVDGAMDEPAWESALRLALAYESYPGENVPAPQRTDCLVVHDERTLYVGFREFQADPAAIRTFLADRDQLSQDEDQVTIVIDTFNDRRRAHAFAVSWSSACTPSATGPDPSCASCRSCRSTGTTTASCARRRRSPDSAESGPGSTWSSTRR